MSATIVVNFEKSIPCQWQSDWCQVIAVEYREFSSSPDYYIVYKNNQLYRVAATHVSIRISS